MLTTETKNGSLIIHVGGRIDSTNSSQLDDECTSAADGFEGSSVIIDAENLEYISSAGLRVILKLKKKKPELVLVNASPEVYDVLDMTGFTEMMHVEKAYRRISVDGCEVIGQGANGKVYRIDVDTIIKVYLNPDCLGDIQRERDLARKAFVLGIPTAIPYDVVKVGDGYGSVFELLNSKSLTKIIAGDPSREDECVKMYVDLLKTIHSTAVKKGDMPDMKETVIDWVTFLKPYLDERKAEKLYRLVSEIPEDFHVIHGDYHTKNVMVQNEEPLLIDMDTLAYGNPVFEFASMYNAFIGFSELDNSISKSFLGIDHEIAVDFWKKSVAMYFGTDDVEKLEEIENKAAIIGYARLMRRLIRRKGLETEEGRKTIAFYREQIETRLGKTDTLVF